ncbi:MAG: flavin reductase family protein [Candidatus Melainabacteria bacterium HGW-Melainabacteria-1]|nr:MAG: flavin reductase family protein [Candidatus Melainabacteria bacterium HGW-Melainabacteria-1]
MKTIHVADTPWREAYARLTEIVQPRPIALVSSLDPEFGPNLAPFSFFMVVSSNPLYIAFSPQIAGRTGSKKDTLLNIERHPEFVVATVTEAIAERVNAASTPLPHGESEFDFTGLTPLPAQRVKAFCVKESPVNLECSLVEIRSYGHAPGAGNLIVAQVELMHIDESVLDPAGRVDPALLQTVARMGGEDWCRSRDRFSFPRPDR